MCAERSQSSNTKQVRIWQTCHTLCVICCLCILLIGICSLLANTFTYEPYVQLNAERYMTSLADGFADSNRKMHLLRSCLNTTALDEAFNAACCNQTEAAVTYGKTRK